MAALAVALLVGWVLIIGGIAHLVSAFSGGGAGRIFWQVLIAAVYLLGGFYFLTHTVMGVGTLTLLLAGIILAEGVFEVIAYFKARGSGGSVWLLINGLITLLLGGLIWVHWPSSSTWAIGTLLGINLLMTGITRLMFGLAARKLVAGKTGGLEQKDKAWIVNSPRRFFAARGIFCSDAIRNLFASTGKGRGG